MSSRRQKDLRAACDSVEQAITARQTTRSAKARGRDDKYLAPFRLACDTRSAKIVSKALDCMQKLMAYGYLRGRRLVPWGRGGSAAAAADRTHHRHSVRSKTPPTRMCSSRSSRPLSRHVQPLRSARQLAQAVQACYHIHLESRFPINQSTAKGTS